MKKLLFTLTVLLGTTLSKAQDITGDWHGVLKVQGMELRLVFHIANEGRHFSATLDSPDQNAHGIQASQVQYEDAHLSITIASLGAKYEGKPEESNRIVGTFSQGGQSFPLDLHRNEVKKQTLHRPQEPTKPYPYYAEEVSFSSEGGKIKLAGTLTLPQEQGVFPAVILITGSGPQNRDEEFMTHKPFLVLADHLSRNGIAVLRYDDRGFASSTGDFTSATSLDFAEDVKSAIEYLKTRHEIDKSQIGLIGHSEGGLIAPIVATQSEDVSFLVMLAGPGVPGDQILLEQTELIGKTMGAGEVEIGREQRLAKQIFQIVKQSENPAETESQLREFLERVFEENPELAASSGMDKESFINRQVAQGVRPWFKYFLQYDPAVSLRKVQCPVLALNGEKDVQVSPNNLTLIQKALAEGGNKNVTIREFPGMNHLFQECETGAMAEYARIEQTFSPIALTEISNWISGLISE